MDQNFENSINNDDWDGCIYRLSGFSFAKVPVLTSEDPDKVQAFNWGLIPKWSKDEEQANELKIHTLNARSETVFEKPSFRSSISKKRCLLFVKGFHEWREFNKKKYPYYIHLKDQEVFTLGGIYESWVNKETGELFNTTSIITTEANPLMEKIHNSKKRMPLILTGDAMQQWIDPTINKERITDLMRPFDEKKMLAYTISKLITSRKEDPNQEKVKKEFVYEDLPPIG
jgi:putative SOS response-associated peptidase YedK